MRVLSIIISFNFEPWLDKCLQSLMRSNFPTDIMVVDNSSSDNTVELIQRNYPNVILIESKENLGFGKANNIGFEYALKNDYDFVFLINQDAWIHPDCLSKLLATPISQGIGVLSPIHYDGTEKELDQGFEDYMKKGFKVNKNCDALFINAAFWLIPINTLKKVGSFSPLFYHYGEDKDFANRLHYYHYHFLVIEEAHAYHDRQDRPVHLTGPKFFNSEYIFFLTEYANINYSLTKAFAYSVLASIKKALIRLSKMDVKAFISYTRLGIKILCKTKSVLMTRKENKNRA